MSDTVRLDIQDGNITAALQKFFKSVMATEDIDAMLLPLIMPPLNVPAHALVSDLESMDLADVLAPSLPLNGAKQVSKLTRKSSGVRFAAVLRSCEIRALIELVKLNQASVENLLIISVDCLGVYSNRAYRNFSGTGETFYKEMLDGKEMPPEISSACRCCEYPVSKNSDINIGLVGEDSNSHLTIVANTGKGEKLLKLLDLATTDETEKRKDAVKKLVDQRIVNRDRMFTETEEKIGTLEKLGSYLSGCVNCYNCRVACPVCYCKECVFLTDVFDHEPFQYLNWSRRKKALKMPPDTVFFHLTRMAHMSLSCVGCGQCTNACPNDIPLFELFRTVSKRTQESFDYEPGRSIDDSPPLSEFKVDELTDMTS